MQIKAQKLDIAEPLQIAKTLLLFSIERNF